MLLRELVRRTAPEGALVAVAAAPAVVEELALACRAVPVDGLDGEPEVVVVDLGDGTAARDVLAPLLGAHAADAWVLALACPPEELPWAPLLEAVRDLAFVEAVPLQGASRVGLVAARRPRPVRAYLTGEELEGAELPPRVLWEWGLLSLGQRGLVEQLEALRAERASLREQLDVAQANRAASVARADAYKTKAEALEQRLEDAEERETRGEPARVLGQDLLRLRRHPLSGARALLRDARRLRRR